MLINNLSKYKINLTVSSQNCNSINVASSVKNMYTQISAITKLGSDIILLSDVRLGKKSREVISHFSKYYKCVFNSAFAKRGVGLLYKRDLDLDILILDTFRDPKENILLLKCRIANDTIILGSIYGPNADDNRLFFSNIL